MSADGGGSGREEEEEEVRRRTERRKRSRGRRSRKGRKDSRRKRKRKVRGRTVRRRRRRIGREGRGGGKEEAVIWKNVNDSSSDKLTGTCASVLHGELETSHCCCIQFMLAMRTCVYNIKIMIFNYKLPFD